MARFIMIQIDDNAAADRFVEAVEKGTVLYDPDKIGESPSELGYELEAKVKAVFGVPTMFCECPDYRGVSAPSKTYRWMVHAKCGKPARGAYINPLDLTRKDWKASEQPFFLSMRADQRGYLYRKEE
jgi:hypothetical protein